MGEIESGKMQWVCVCVEGEERKWWEEGGGRSVFTENDKGK